MLYPSFLRRFHTIYLLMKHFSFTLTLLTLLLEVFSLSARTPLPQVDYSSLPRQIASGDQGKNHVQGIAFDAQNGCVYMSFTTSLIKVDLQGRLLGSVKGLTGHLGCLALNPDDGRLYGSLEYKHDAIGSGIMQGLGVQNSSEDGFYIAVFDVDRITRPDMDASEVMRCVYIRRAVEDYKARVTNQGREVDHRYGCSGIDGVAIGPRWGKKGGKNVLYVAYGIYSETERSDNDYQVILCYNVSRWDKWAKPISPQDLHHSGPRKPQQVYFARTGNTTWGVQNLAYDPTSQYLLAAVYPGQKTGWPNYELFALDMQQKPRKQTLLGVEPQTTGKVVPLRQQGLYDATHDVWGWHFPYGSTGLCPLGNGYYYISHNGKNKETGKQNTVLHLYRWVGTPEKPLQLAPVN